jgi:ribosomal protein L31
MLVAGVVRGEGDVDRLNLEIKNSAGAVVAEAVSSEGQWQATVQLEAGVNQYTAAVVGAPAGSSTAEFAVEKTLSTRRMRSPVVDSQGNRLLVIDGFEIDFSPATGQVDLIHGSRSIMQVSLDTGIRRKFSGDGVEFRVPTYMVWDDAKRIAYVFDAELNAVIAVDGVTADRELLLNFSSALGDGVDVDGAWFDSAGGRIIVQIESDDSLNQFWEIDPESGDIALLSEFSFSEFGKYLDGEQPMALNLDGTELYFFASDLIDSRLHRLNLKTGSVELISPQVVARTNPVSDAGLGLSGIESLVFDPDRAHLYVTGSKRVKIGTCSCLQDVVIEVNIESGEHREIIDIDIDVGSHSYYTLSGNKRLLAVEPGLDHILDINLEEASYAVLSDAYKGRRGGMSPYGYIVYDSSRELLLTRASVSGVADYIAQVDLTTGELTPFYDEPSPEPFELTIPMGIDFDSKDHLYWVTPYPQSLVSYDLSTNKVDGLVPIIPGLFVQDLCVNSSAERAYTVTPDAEPALIEINLEDGQNDFVSTDTPLNASAGLICNRDSGEVIVGINSPADVRSVDLKTGNSSIISDDEVGAGERITSISDMVLSPDKKTVYVADWQANKVVAIELSSGQRRLVSGAGVGGGSPFESLSRLQVYNSEVLLVLEAESPAILSVHIPSGERAIISN